jgi:hypothetical protein
MPKGNRQESGEEGLEFGLEPQEMGGQVRQEDGEGLGDRPSSGLLEGENESSGTGEILERTRRVEGSSIVRDKAVGIGIAYPIREVDGIRDTKRPDYKRQVSIFNPDKFTNVGITIAGLGNIGSHTALALTRMGLTNFVIVDFDTVEEHNLSSQAYNVSDVGVLKTDALMGHMLALNPDVHVKAISEPFTGKEQQGSILISAVDSMVARRKICEGLPADTFVFDGRMGGGQIEVHSQTQAEWGATLEIDGDEDPCGARFISYTSYIVAGLIANNVKRYLLKQKYAKRILFHADTLDLIKVW